MADFLRDSSAKTGFPTFRPVKCFSALLAAAIVLSGSIATADDLQLSLPRARTGKEITLPSSRDDTPLTEAQPAGSYLLEGFRSARFGMTPGEVAKAIGEDFGLTEKQITATRLPDSGAPLMMIRTEDLVPDTGTVVIAYGFARDSSKLARITLIWGAPAVPDIKTSRLLRAAGALQRHFLLQGYSEDDRIVNGVMEDGGLIAFRAQDKKGRGTLLRLDLPMPVEQALESPEATGGTLKLSYMYAPDTPWHFPVEQGSF